MSDAALKQSEPMGDAARLLLAAARERFSVAATDMLLPENTRLTEWQRVTASTLLERLVRSIEDMFRAHLASHFANHEALQAALGSTNVEIALPLLQRAQVLRDAELGTILVRRVEEHRYWMEHFPAGGDELFGALVRDDDAEIAGEAMSLIIARSRRFDRFQEPVIGEADLPAELQHRLVWLIAAALRQYMIQQHTIPSGAADMAISTVANELIAGYDEGKSLEASSVRLARRLMALGRLEGDGLAHMLEGGQLTLFIAALGVRTSLDYAATWEVLSDPAGRGPALLLRSGRIDRQAAARILLMLNSRGRLFSGQEGEAAVAQLNFYDSISEAAATEILQLWRSDPGYRLAIAALSTRGRPANGSV